VCCDFCRIACLTSGLTSVAWLHAGKAADAIAFSCFLNSVEVCVLFNRQLEWWLGGSVCLLVLCFGCVFFYLLSMVL